MSLCKLLPMLILQSADRDPFRVQKGKSLEDDGGREFPQFFMGWQTLLDAFGEFCGKCSSKYISSYLMISSLPRYIQHKRSEISSLFRTRSRMIT